MAEVYTNSEAEVIEITPGTVANPIVIGDEESARKQHELSEQKILKALLQENNDESYSTTDNNVSGDSGDSGINGDAIYDTNDNSELFYSVLEDKQSVTLNGTLEINGDDHSLHDVTVESDLSVNGGVVSNELEDSSCTSINNKNEDSHCDSSEISTADVSSDDEVESGSESEDSEDSASVSESHLKAVDGVALTESYVEIDADDAKSDGDGCSATEEPSVNGDHTLNELNELNVTQPEHQSEVVEVPELASESVSAEPLSTESVSNELMSSEAVSTDILSESLPSEFTPIVAIPTETEVLPTETLSTEIVPTEVVPSEIVPTEIVPTEIVPTEEAPTEEAPTQLVTTESLPTEVVPAEIVCAIVPDVSSESTEEIKVEVSTSDSGIAVDIESVKENASEEEAVSALVAEIIVNAENEAASEIPNKSEDAISTDLESAETVTDSKTTSNSTQTVEDSKSTSTQTIPESISCEVVVPTIVAVSEAAPVLEAVSVLEAAEASAEVAAEVPAEVAAEVPAEVPVEEPEEEWLDILGNDLLKKKIILKGEGEASRAVPGSVVTVRCEGRLNNGCVVDKQEKLQFILSDEDVIQAFDLAIALMENKEVATVYTDARYAYGIHGRPDFNPPIPQNAALTYEIEILSIEEGLSLDKMTGDQRVEYGDKKRTRGNDLYSRDDFAGSINAYKRGIKYLEGTADEKVMSMKIKCLNNLSAAQLKVKAYRMAIQSLDTVLQFEPENVKALFRKGKCLRGLKKDKEALECIKQASLLDPQNKSILQELGQLKSKVAVTTQKEKQMYQKMFTAKKEEKISKEEEDLNWTVQIQSAVVGVLGLIAGYLWYKHR